jgi:hypothetical protein
VSRLALALSLLAFAAAVVDGQTMFVGMGLGAFAVCMGVVAYRQVDRPGWARLQGASAVAVGVVATVLATGRFALTWWAVGRLQSLLS